MKLFVGEKKGVSPVIGVVLMVAITVALAAVVAIVVTSSGDQLNEGSANAKIEFNAHPAGLEMVVEQISTNAEVHINDQSYTTISKDSAGRRIILPTAKGDSIVLVSGNSESTVLVTKQIDDKSDEGDFIGRWTFSDDDDESVLKDGSSVGNDATVTDGTADLNNGVATFDGLNDNQGYQINSLEAPSNTDEITIMAKYSLEGPSDHTDDSGNNGWPRIINHRGGSGDNILLFANDGHDPQSDEYATLVNVDGTDQKIENYKFGETYKVGFTAEVGSQGVMYSPGMGTKSVPTLSSFTLDKLDIGYEDSSYDYDWDGDIYEIRFYYTAMDEGELKESVDSM